jgi:hypothetical protein
MTEMQGYQPPTARSAPSLISVFLRAKQKSIGSHDRAAGGDSVANRSVCAPYHDLRVNSLFFDPHGGPG